MAYQLNGWSHYALAVQCALENPGREVEWLLEEKKTIQAMGIFNLDWTKVDRIIARRNEPPPAYSEVTQTEMVGQVGHVEQVEGVEEVEGVEGVEPFNQERRSRSEIQDITRQENIARLLESGELVARDYPEDNQSGW